MASQTETNPKEMGLGLIVQEIVTISADDAVRKIFKQATPGTFPFISNYMSQSDKKQTQRQQDLYAELDRREKLYRDGQLQ